MLIFREVQVYFLVAQTAPQREQDLVYADSMTAMLAQVLGPVDQTAFQGACLTLLEMRNFLIGIGCIYFFFPRHGIILLMKRRVPVPVCDHRSKRIFTFKSSTQSSTLIFEMFQGWVEIREAFDLSTV